MKQNVSALAAAEVEKFVEQLIAGETDRASARCDLMFALRAKGLIELCDEEWLNGVLDLNFSLRCEWRHYNHGQRTLDAAPAQEFYRAFSRKVPRDWLCRWTDTGGQLYDGRMIALKNDPIWYALSDFGFPFPPFALGSGMRVRSVDRRTAMELKMIDLNRQTAPQEVQRPHLILLEPTREEA